jgi:serine/threonine protein kinase/tetratricopeptide (TPR) repeat protein
MSHSAPCEPSFDPLETEPRSAGLEAVLAELAAGWAEGANPTAESFAERVVADGSEAFIELIYHEFCLAEAAGHAPDPAAYLKRFPIYGKRLECFFGLHEALGNSVLDSYSIHGDTPLPSEGDEIGPYRLLRELGRGGMARVFLAEQADLDDRLVVLKVAARPSLEANLQARVRHPHIVEILRQGRTEDGGLHLIAMPFLGGATLAAVLAQETKHTGWMSRRSGRSFLEALDRVSAPEFIASESARSASRDQVASLSRAKAAAWIVARLAEALEHAARMGVTHGDLKPSNILIAADARPMLFDFNLAADWRSTETNSSGPTGGTLAYMAPERLRALANPKSTSPPRPADRQRADLYAIGLVLREILTASLPKTPEFTPSKVRQTAGVMAEAREQVEATHWLAHRRIPTGLRPILAKCLAPEPADRYSRMSELAEDLDLWRENRSILHAERPTNFFPRGGSWVRRNRHRVAVASALLVVAIVTGLATWSIMSARLHRQAESKLASVWDTGDRAAFRGRRFGAWRLDDDSTAEICRQNLERYRVFNAADWRFQDEVRSLGTQDRIDLEMWLVEQAWRLASAWAKRPDSPDDRRRALAILEKTPEWAAIEAFSDLLQSLRKDLGKPPLPRSEVRPPEWLERYAAGLVVESTDAKAAIGVYEAILAKMPRALWPHYRAAAVASRLGDYAVAADHLKYCLERRPNNVALMTQRSGCLLGMGLTEAALASCSHALELDPGYGDAYLMSAMVRIRLEQTEAAQADIDRFVVLSRARPAETWEGRLTFITRSEHGGATRSSTSPLVEAGEAQSILGLFLEKDKRPDAAIEAYTKAIEYDPEDLRSRARRANLLVVRRKNEGINEMAAIILDRRYEELVREDEYMLRLCLFVAEYQLANGAVDQARALAQRALDVAQHQRGARVAESPLVAESRYALARAIAPAAASDPKAARLVADLLTQAAKIDKRYLSEKFVGDKFFDVARKQIAAALGRARPYKPEARAKDIP